jgi:hypothetical protein
VSLMASSASRVLMEGMSLPAAKRITSHAKHFCHGRRDRFFEDASPGG